MKRVILLLIGLAFSACASMDTSCLESGDVVIHKNIDQRYTREGTTVGAPGTRSMRQIYQVTVRKATGQERTCNVTPGEYDQAKEGQPYTLS
jgi:hypothetical protein